MDWEALREKTLGEVGTALATEGLGVAGGFVGASFIGRQIENVIMGKTGTAQNYVVIGDTWATKFKAWAANNVPKLGIWYLLRNYAKVEPGEMVTPGKEITVDAKKAFAGSVVFDSLVRATNHGLPIQPSPKFMGIDWLGPSSEPQTPALQADMQRLIQENSALRSELNKALQRIASTPAPTPIPTPVQAPTVQVQAPPTPPPAAPVVRYQPVQAAPPTVTYSEQRPPAPVPVRRAEEEASPMPYAYAQPVPPAVSERERKYGFMQYDQTPPAVQERQRKYAFMDDKGEKDIAAMFGML